MSPPIRQLLDHILWSVLILEKACDENETAIPDLHEPFTFASEAFRRDPVVAEAARVICGAALQIEAILAPPQVSLTRIMSGVRQVNCKGR